MAKDTTSILLSDISIDGDVVEKDKIILDAKINGDIKAEEIEPHSNSNMFRSEADVEPVPQVLSLIFPRPF